MAKGFKATDYSLPKTGVQFSTEAEWLARLFRRCEEACVRNQAVYTDKRVLREGSDYDGVWLETQPMGGEMYAKRDVETALNNQLIFMENQRRSGRLPGMIKFQPPFLLQVFYDWLQGFCFPVHALRMYYLIGRDEGYLRLLQQTLRDFDEYLWRYRDSAGSGCLEVWCTWDTAEDNSERFLRYGAKDGGFGGEDAPVGIGRLPYRSMDMMGYSCQARQTLGEICDLLGEPGGDEWRAKAQAVRDKVRDYLWIDEKDACYDRDCEGGFMDVLIHNNLRCMYYGVFSQDMADRFVRSHLLNPEEFWTYVPLPSIAVNDPCFRNINFNNWSGQPQGLTYQRAILTLQNYGHHAEIRLLGRKWLRLLNRTGRLVQQYDPFDGTPCVTRAEGKAPAGEETERYAGVVTLGADGYGPTVLAALEYISLLGGVNIAEEKIRWSALPDWPEGEYAQRLGEHVYTAEIRRGVLHGRIDGEERFSCSAGAEVLTDLQGRVLRVTGIHERPALIALAAEGTCMRAVIAPNEVCVPRGGRLEEIERHPFDYPYWRAK